MRRWSLRPATVPYAFGLMTPPYREDACLEYALVIGGALGTLARYGLNDVISRHSGEALSVGGSVPLALSRQYYWLLRHRRHRLRQRPVFGSRPGSRRSG